MIGYGFRTPIGYAFSGGKSKMAKWLIQMGAQNLIHNAIWSENYANSFQIIDETGKTLANIKEDLPRIKNLNLLTDEWTLDGIKELVKFYEKDETIFRTILFILMNLKLDNDPEKEILWAKKLSEISEQFPVAKRILMMEWEKCQIWQMDQIILFLYYQMAKHCRTRLFSQLFRKH